MNFKYLNRVKNKIIRRYILVKLTNIKDKEENLKQSWKKIYQVQGGNSENDG